MFQVVVLSHYIRENVESLNGSDWDFTSAHHGTMSHSVHATWFNNQHLADKGRVLLISRFVLPVECIVHVLLCQEEQER